MNSSLPSNTVARVLTTAAAIVRPASSTGGSAGLSDKAPGRYAIADDLDGRRRRAAVAGCVDHFEGLHDLRHVGEIHVDRNRQLEGLAGVAHVEAGGEAPAGRREAGCFQLSLAILAQVRKHGPDLGRRKRVGRGHLGAHQIAAHVGHKQAESREIAGHRRDDNGSHAQLVGDPDGVQRARAAIGEQREIARIDAAQDRHFLDRRRHRHHGDTQDALGHLLGRQTDRPETSPRPQSRRRGRGDLAAEQMLVPSRPSTTLASVTVGSTPPRP